MLESGLAINTEESAAAGSILSAAAAQLRKTVYMVKSWDICCKTVHQYSREPVSAADMKKLQEIADDYCRVKNYVYARYGGIGSLAKIYPGYTVQNEMTASGLRAELGMPSVYFYLAVFDALGDIKSQWTRTKSKLQELVSRNENFTEEERHYLRFLLKTNNAFTAVLNRMPVELPEGLLKQHDMLAFQTDAAKLHSYLCRQVRRHHVKLHARQASGFAVAERAYRYADHGIYISVKEKRRRVFIPLTDSCRYKAQIYVRLYPDENRIEINAPVHTAVRSHADYQNETGISFGMQVMLTTDSGHQYGTLLGEYQSAYAQWIQAQQSAYSRSRKDNPGRKKYYAKKRRLEEQLHSYINHELNRFLQMEKPRTVYAVKLPKPQKGGVNKAVNYAASMWQRGYIKKRLEQKCREQAVEIVKVLGKDISRECSCCAAAGSRKDGVFTCTSCGYSVQEKTNAARNALKRGRNGQALNRLWSADSLTEKPKAELQKRS